MRGILTLGLCCLFLPAIVFAASTCHVTELYEVGQGSVILITKGQTQKRAPTHIMSPSGLTGGSLIISKQYVYSPYGIQKNLNHTRANSPLTFTGEGVGERVLFNQTRKPLNIAHNQFGYTGQSLDPSTNLMMLGGFRNYAPGIGRFIQPDTDNSFSKHHIDNSMAYLTANPMLLTDPSGHFGVLTLLNTVMAGEAMVSGFAAAFSGFDVVAGVSAALSGGLGIASNFTHGLTQQFLGMGAMLSGMTGAFRAGMTAAEQASESATTGSKTLLTGSAGLNFAAAGNMLASTIAIGTQNQALGQITSAVGYGLMGIGLLTGTLGEHFKKPRVLLEQFLNSKSGREFNEGYFQERTNPDNFEDELSRYENPALISKENEKGKIKMYFESQMKASNRLPEGIGHIKARLLRMMKLHEAIWLHYIPENTNQEMKEILSSKDFKNKIIQLFPNTVYTQAAADFYRLIPYNTA